MTIIHADILDWAKTYTGPKFHALLCDPPYHMVENHKRYSSPDAAPPGYGNDGSFQRLSKGFMGKTWDGGDIAFQPSTWAALAEHLYPGAFGMAFASSRGWHRLACAIEDAGLIIHPTIFGWSYGSGFPKATRIDTQIDAAAFRAWLALHPAEQAAYKAAQAAERAARKAGDKQATKETKAELQALSVAYKALAGLTPAKLGTRKQAPKFDVAAHGGTNSGYNRRVDEHGQAATFDITGAATEAAAHWLGHRYGGQALKPALEPVIVFQKPYDGSPLACITSSGAGALNIDAGRIKSDEDCSRAPSVVDSAARFGYSEGGMGGTGHASGRWPANLILSHSPACNGECAPGCPVAALGAQSGQLSSGTGAIRRDAPGMFGLGGDGQANTEYGDTGTAARFFFQADYMAERLELADNPLGYNCLICDCKAQRRGIMNEKQHTTTEGTCDHATNAESSSSQRSAPADFVQTPAQDSGKRASAARSASKSTLAHNAGSSSKSSQETNASIAQLSAANLQVEQIAQDARSVVSLCDSCATAIAQSLVAMQRGSDPALPLGQASIPERIRQILIQSLALFAVSQAKSGTTPTIADLNTLFGFVSLAIEASPKPRAGVDPVLYFPKSSRSEREAGLDPRQTAIMRLLDDSDDCFDLDTVSDGRETPIDNPYQRGETTRRNTHPTIKPISLARYLATLLLPPAQYGPRRLLIPFSGAGSEVIGADLAGWEDVTGIELGADHCAIANARRAYWQQRRWELLDPARKLTVKSAPKAPQGQIDMFMDDQRAMHREWMENTPTFDEWHAATGGDRNEYDRMSLPPMTHDEWLAAHEEAA